MFLLNYESAKLEPWLATGMTHNDTKDVWTLSLRKGITWNDGIPYTADDVLFTTQILVDHAKDFGAGWIKAVKSTDKVDDLTIKFTLAKPDPFFQLNNFASKIVGSFNVVPKHVFDGKDAATFNNFDLSKGWPLGTGPYKLVKTNQTETTFDLDPNYWAQKQVSRACPLPSASSSRLLALKKLPAPCSLSTRLITRRRSAHRLLPHMPQKSEPDRLVRQAPYAWFDPCERNLEFNVSKSPFNDKDIRYAISYAIDRAQVVAIAYGGNSLPSKSPFPNYGGLSRYVKLAEDAGLYTKYPVGTYNLDAAAKIMTDKGYTKGSDGYYQKGGQSIAFDLVTPNYPEIVAVGQVVAEQLQSFGINATQRKEDPGVFDVALHNGTVDAWIGWEMCGSVNEALSSLNTLNNFYLVPTGTRADTNFWRWDNAEYSKIMTDWAKLALDDPNNDKAFLQAYEIHLRELPVIPVAQAIKMIAFDKTYWTNWPSVDNNYIQPPTWWQSTAEIIHNIKPSGAQ